jgi:hypothetical protein
MKGGFIMRDFGEDEYMKEVEGVVKKDTDIQRLLSRKIIGQIKDKSIQQVLRQILFSNKNMISWQQALEVICQEIPELEMFE